MSTSPSTHPSALPSTSPGKSSSTHDLSTGVKGSLIAHLTFFLLLFLQSLIFPSRVIPWVPTLQVDWVALPSDLKKNLTHPSRTQMNQEIAKLLKKVEKEAKITPIETTTPLHKQSHPMLLPGKTVEKRNLRALQRIKALSKIQAFSDEALLSLHPSASRPINGNRISPGKSLSGEAKEANQTSYYDTLRDRLVENWTLPPWIKRQPFSAQVLIFINHRGELKNFRFKKFSGNAQFDEAIRRTLKMSQPFPPPPEELTGSLLSDGIIMGFPL